LAHGTVFGLFCFLSLRAFRGTFPKARISSIAVWAVLMTVAYGATDEFHQIFVPSRDSDVLDLAADGAGALVVSAIWYRWGRGEEKRHASVGALSRKVEKKHPKV